MGHSPSCHSSPKEIAGYMDIYGFSEHEVKMLDRRFYQLVDAEEAANATSSRTRSSSTSSSRKRTNSTSSMNSNENNPDLEQQNLQEAALTFRSQTIWKHASELLTNPLKDVIVMAFTKTELPSNAYCMRYPNTSVVDDSVNFERFLEVMSVFLKLEKCFLHLPPGEEKKQKCEELRQKKIHFLFNIYVKHKEEFITKAGLATAAAYVFNASKQVQDVVSEIWHEYEKICPVEFEETPERIYLDSFEKMVNEGSEDIISQLQIEF
eukprot:m.64321 g.64321  ORF g.64321 m.64321 type:complete len:265 (-) comp23414_c0_seq1:89-883(-)